MDIHTSFSPAINNPLTNLLPSNMYHIEDNPKIYNYTIIKVRSVCITPVLKYMSIIRQFYCINGQSHEMNIC
jgi:hypothetical protein